MNYRPLATQDLEKLVARLESLMASTQVPWHFDADAHAFYVEDNGERLYINFEAGDVETQLVETVTAGLPLLLAAIRNRFYFLDLEGVKAPTRKGTP